MCIELAEGCNTDVWHNHFSTLIEQWPSLEAKWHPTKGSLVRKGDVIEVCLAFCRETGPAINRNIAERRNWFREDVQKFWTAIREVVRLICKCDDGYPTSKYLPNPTNFARLLMFVWSGLNNHNEEHRKDSIVKADKEKECLMTRIGAHNWFDDPADDPDH